MGKLEYDDSAFAYFGLTFICLFGLPYTYYYYTTTFNSPQTALTGVDQLPPTSLKKLLKTNKAFKPRSDIEERRIKELLRSKSSLGNIFDKFSFKTIVKTIILLIAWYNIYAFATLCYNEETQISSFDPYEILDVSRDSTEQQIRKKYRKLSIKWHPDQWMKKSLEERERAEATFIKISKAYTALTDETSRNNYKKYGNPDGPQPMELSLGLPSFLLDKKNHNVVLLIYIIVLVVLIPTFVFIYYTNSRRYSDKLILNETYLVLAYLLNPNTTTKHLVDVLALSAEFRSTVPSSTETDDVYIRLRKLLLKHDCCPRKPVPSAVNLFKKWPSNEKVYLLLQAHLYRSIPLYFPLNESQRNECFLLETLDEAEVASLRETLNKVLVQCPILLDAMSEVAVMRRSLRLVHRVMTFRQCLIQAVYPYSPNALTTLPGFHKYPALLKKLNQKGMSSLTEIRKTKLTDDDFSGKIKGVEIPEEVKEGCKLVLDPLHGIRKPEIKAFIGCLDYETKKTGKIVLEKKFGQKDVVTIYIVFNYTGKAFEDEDKLAKPKLHVAYTPYFPMFFKESFKLTVGVNGSEEPLLQTVDVVADKEFIRAKLLFKPDFKKPGKYNFDLYVKSKVYLGVDEQFRLVLDVLDQNEIEELIVHPEDLEAEKTPGLFDVFETQEEEDSDFESDDDEQKGKEVKK